MKPFPILALAALLAAAGCAAPTAQGDHSTTADTAKAGKSPGFTRNHIGPGSPATRGTGR